MADDEFVTQNGYEPEQIEIFLHYNKQMVNEMREARSASYDYLQKGGAADSQSERDGDSQLSMGDFGNDEKASV